MASTIITKNSSTASAAPTAGQLVQGELAVNVTDKRLYIKDSGGTVVGITGASGGGSNAVFFENDQAVTTNYSITTGKNAMSAGPVSINSGVSVTVPTGSVWTIV